jgi:hypothetical protein
MLEWKRGKINKNQVGGKEKRDNDKAMTKTLFHKTG